MTERNYKLTILLPEIKQTTETDYYTCYKNKKNILTETCPVNNGKLN
jgi:hypothetical protein